MTDPPDTRRGRPAVHEAPSSPEMTTGRHLTAEISDDESNGGLPVPPVLRSATARAVCSGHYFTDQTERARARSARTRARRRWFAWRHR